MEKVIAWLKGKKTYICAVALFLTYGAEGMGWITRDVADFLKGMLAAGGLASMRLAVGRRK